MCVCSSAASVTVIRKWSVTVIYVVVIVSNSTNFHVLFFKLELILQVLTQFAFILETYSLDRADIKTEIDIEDFNTNLVVYECTEMLSMETKRWSVADTFALIAAYNKYRNQFVFAKKRKDVWEIITAFLQSNGIQVSFD